MQIDFLGHAAFLLTSSAGTRVLFDPYESGSFHGRIGYGPIEEAVDLVVVTHDHADHCYTQSLPPGFQTIRHEGAFRDIEVRSVPAFHDHHQGTRFGGVVDMKLVLVDGMRLCHAGDLGQLLEAHHLRALRPLDLLILPVGGFYTIGPEDALQVTRQLSPKVVIPCHYRCDRCSFEIARVDPFLAGFDEVIRPGQSALELSLDSLPEHTTCVHLEPRL